MDIVGSGAGDLFLRELAFDEPTGGAWGSDHFGVVADLSGTTSAGRPVR